MEKKTCLNEAENDKKLADNKFHIFVFNVENKIETWNKKKALDLMGICLSKDREYYLHLQEERKKELKYENLYSEPPRPTLSTPWRRRGFF